MKKSIMLKIKLTFILIAIFVFLFPKNIFAETITVDGVDYTYVTPDDGNDGADFDDVNVVLTTYSGAGLGAGYNGDEAGLFSTNTEYGWTEFNEDGEKYIVVATATHEFLNAAGDLYDYQHWRFDHIHYFRYHQKLSLKIDEKVFPAIVLDSCGKSGFPQSPIWNHGLGSRT